MDKESKILEQKINANCNDCIFLQRDKEKRKKSLEQHDQWQRHHFEVKKQNLIDKAKSYQKAGYPDKAKNLFDEASKMKYQFDSSTASIHYGRCLKFDKDIEFIPNIFQLTTQECFEHRNDYKK